VVDCGFPDIGRRIIPNSELKTAIVEALVKQLDARIEITTGPTGTSFTSRLPKAAADLVLD